MHEAAKRWDLKYGARYDKMDMLPTARPCDRCGHPATIGYIHPECAWAEVEALDKEAEARSKVRRKLTGRRGSVARINGRYIKEALTTKPPRGKLKGNKESSHAAPLSPQKSTKDRPDSKLHI